MSSELAVGLVASRLDADLGNGRDEAMVKKLESKMALVGVITTT